VTRRKPTASPLSKVRGAPSAGAAEALVAGAIDKARARWPELSVDEAHFARYVAERLPAKAGWSELQSLHWEDLYLACACAQGQPEAFAAFEVHAMLPGTAGLERIVGVERADEARQLLRLRLLFGESGEARRIGDYEGKGALAAWLRVGALRTAKNLQRTDDAQNRVGVRAPPVDRGTVPDPEMDYLKLLFRKELGAAVDETLRGMERDDRTLLRLYFFDGSTEQAIAKLFQVHVSTVSRKLHRAREAILKRAKGLLRERMGVSDGELNSLFRLVQSQLDLSLRPVRAAPARPDPEANVKKSQVAALSFNLVAQRLGPSRVTRRPRAPRGLERISL
jgi:RNA polymerase sigma-70 factor (ECF subfamily)